MRIDGIKRYLKGIIEQIIQHWIVSVSIVAISAITTTLIKLSGSWIIAPLCLPTWVILLLPTIGAILGFCCHYFLVYRRNLTKNKAVSYLGVNWELTKEFFDNALRTRAKETSTEFPRKLIKGPFCPKCSRDIESEDWMDAPFSYNCVCGEEFQKLREVGTVEEVIADCYTTFKARYRKGEI